MEQFSDTESEPEQFPLEPVVDDTSLEKKPKRKYAKKVKVVEPTEPVAEVKVEKPKRVMTEEHKEKMRLAREASKARKALAKPAPITRQETEAPQAEEPTDVKPKRKYTRKPKDEVAEPKVVVKEIHHHYNEPKAKKENVEKAPRKPRVKKEVQPKQVVPSVDFV
jgi:hypothetical protein